MLKTPRELGPTPNEMPKIKPWERILMVFNEMDYEE